MVFRNLSCDIEDWLYAFYLFKNLKKITKKNLKNSSKLKLLSHLLENLPFVSGNKKPIFFPDETFFIQ